MLVFQEAFGVNAHIRDVTQRIAREGYVAIAPELFHRSAAPGLEVRYDDFPSAMPHMKALTEQGLADDVRASYEWLRDSQSRHARPDRQHRILHGRPRFVSCERHRRRCAPQFRFTAAGSLPLCFLTRRICMPQCFSSGADLTNTSRRTKSAP